MSRLRSIGTSSSKMASVSSSRRRFRTQAEAKLAVFQFIEGWYNPYRRHSACGNQTPMRYELNYDRLHQPAA